MSRQQESLKTLHEIEQGHLKPAEPARRRALGPRLVVEPQDSDASARSHPGARGAGLPGLPAHAGGESRRPATFPFLSKSAGA